MAFLFAVLLGCASVMLGVFLYDASRQHFLFETEAAIDSEISHIITIANNMNHHDIANYITQRGKDKTYPIYYLKDAEGNRLAGTIDALPDNVELIKEGIIQFDLFAGDVNQTIAAKIATFKDGSVMLIGRDISPMVERFERLKWFSLAIMVFMVLVVLISFFISTFVVSRINRIARTANDIIDTGDLSKRFAIDSNWDDLSSLSKVLNRLFERTEQLMMDVRHVSDNIAHDLRTPLTRLRNKIESYDPNAITKDDLTTLMQEADHILSMFNSCLRISNIEKGRWHHDIGDVDLSIIMNDVIELYEPLALQSKIKFTTLLEPVIIQGDQDLWFQVLANVVDNAIKYSPPNSNIDIQVGTDGMAQVMIADQGVGIEEEEKEHVFKRFYRISKSRSKPGAGLGLSMVKAVLDMHKASIKLEDNHPGLKVIISMNKK